MTNVSLSDGEWKIMNVLWEKEEGATITELTAGIPGKHRNDGQRHGNEQGADTGRNRRAL